MAWTRSPELLVGVLGGLLAVAGSGVPSYWGDEAASVLSAGRSLPSLLGMLEKIDAVHGLYYLFLHGWIGLFGSSEFAVRLPSAIGVGFAAAGVVVLGTQLVDRRTGVIAGILLALLPVVTRFGIEARSYAFVIAAAVWLIVLLVGLMRRPQDGLAGWVWFAIAFAAAIHLFVYVALLWVVQLAVVVAYRPRREVVVRWLGASGAALLLSLPFMLLCLSQRGQIAFLALRQYATADAVLTGQWFGRVPWLALVVWSLILGAITAGVFVAPLRRAVIIATTWMAVPTLLLLAGNAWVTPMYNLRYTSYSAPAVALLAAVGLRGLALLFPKRATIARWLPVAGISLVAVLAVPGYVAQRAPFAKDGGSDLRQVAELVSENAAPGDAVLFDQTTKPSRRPRLALDLYPERFSGLDDVALRLPYTSRNWLWDKVAPLDEALPKVATHQRIWVVELGSDVTGVNAVRGLGFTVNRALPVHRTTVYELVKD
jgi:mannosyltransferase